MTSRKFFRPLAIVMAPFALAGCETGGDDATEPPSPDDTTSAENDTAEARPAPRELTVTETGWLTVGSDGAVQTTFFDPQGRYRDLRNGEMFAEGEWAKRDESTICFTPDSGLGACWQVETPDENGVAIATNADGKRIEIKQVTYLAPVDADEER